MAKRPDYYSILGVTSSATREEIKAAFRSLARLHHPDKAGDAVKFKEVNEAHGILADDEKRSGYDKERANALVEDVNEGASAVVDEYFRQFARS